MIAAEEFDVDTVPEAPAEILAEIESDLDQIAASQERTLAILRELLGLPEMELLATDAPSEGAWAMWGAVR